jgi:hypothetical protein
MKCSSIYILLRTKCYTIGAKCGNETRDRFVISLTLCRVDTAMQLLTHACWRRLRQMNIDYYASLRWLNVCSQHSVYYCIVQDERDCSPPPCSPRPPSISLLSSCDSWFEVNVKWPWMQLPIKNILRGCKSWSVTPGKGHRLRVFENKERNVWT